MTSRLNICDFSLIFFSLFPLSVFQKFVKSNETIQMKEKVDPSIIGGLVASIGDKYVDMSVSSKIKKYKDLIESAA